MKRMASANASSRSSSSNGKSSAGGYVLCIDNDGYPASLEMGKVYRTVRGSKKVPAGWIRVIDESHEDYLYPARRFVPVEIPPKGRRALSAMK